MYVVKTRCLQITMNKKVPIGLCYQYQAHIRGIDISNIVAYLRPHQHVQRQFRHCCESRVDWTSIGGALTFHVFSQEVNANLELSTTP